MEQERHGRIEQQNRESVLSDIVRSTWKAEETEMSTTMITRERLVKSEGIAEVDVHEYLDHVCVELRAREMTPHVMLGKKVYVLEQGKMLFVPRAVVKDVVLASHHFSRCVAMVARGEHGTIFAHSTESDRASVQHMIESVGGQRGEMNSVLLVLAVVDSQNRSNLSDSDTAWTRAQVTALQESYPSVQICTYRNTDFSPAYIDAHIASTGLPETTIIVTEQEVYAMETVMHVEGGVVRNDIVKGSLTTLQH